MRLAVPTAVVLCVIGGIAGCSAGRDGSPVVAGTVDSSVTASDPDGAPTSADGSTPTASGPGASAGAAGGGAGGTSATGQAGSAGSGAGANGAGGQAGSGGTGGSSSTNAGGQASAEDTRKADCALTATELKPVHDTLSGFVSNPPTDPDVATSNLDAAASAVGSTKGKVTDPGLKKELGSLQGGLSGLSSQISDAASSWMGFTKIGDIKKSAEGVKSQAASVTAYCRA